MSQRPGSTILNDGGNFVPTIHHDTYPRIDPSKVDMKGKAVLVTGASQGIGRAISVSYARAGVSRLALAARSSLSTTVAEVEEACRQAGRPTPAILTLKVDITSPTSVGDAAIIVRNQWGSLDILINNAGYKEAWVKVADADPADWWRAWEVNVYGTFLVSRAFIPLLLNRPTGDKTLVTVSSVGAAQLTPGASAYQTTKFAQLRLGEFLDVEYAQDGLLSYSIHPGGVITAMTTDLPPEIQKLLTDTPALSGDTLVWLTRERRNWLAGRYIDVGWDVDELAAKQQEIVQGDLLKARIDVSLT